MMEMLAADIGLTSFTSLAFCRSSFLLMASSCSSSSFGAQSHTHTHTYIYECMYGNHSHTHSHANFVSAIVQVMLISYTTSPRSGQYASRSRYATFVSSWAFARLSTAMARKTLRRVSGRSLSKENTTNTWQHKQLMLTTRSHCYRELLFLNSFQLVPNC